MVNDQTGSLYTKRVSKHYYPKDEYNEDVATCAIRHLNEMRRLRKRSTVKNQEFSKLCLMMFHKNVDDVKFMNKLAADLGFNSREELLGFVNTNKEVLEVRAGRPMSVMVERQTAYDFWKEKSDISNDRRNARHMIKIKPNKRDKAIADLSDENVKPCESKGGDKLKAQKHVYNFTVRELYKEFKKKNPQLKISSSLFFRCKPLYVSPATELEPECYLCRNV